MSDREKQAADSTPRSGFELVKATLDDLFAVVKNLCGDDVVEKVKAQLQALSDSYGELLKDNRPPVDYSSPVARLAYLYTYVAAHSRWVYDILMETKETRAVLGSAELTVTSFGGGPGTELVAMVKACKEMGTTKSLLCFQIDKEDGWTETWADIDRRVQADFRVTTSLRTIDLAAPLKLENLQKALNANILFAVFFLSEIYRIRTQASPGLRQLAASVKSGAIVVYLDNNNAEITEFACSIFTTEHYQLLKSVDAQNLTLNSDEQKSSLGPYLEMFKPRMPRLRANAAIRVWRKK